MRCTFRGVIALLVSAPTVSANPIFTLSDPGLPGLSAEVEFTLLNPTSLQVRVKNTSTGVPGGFSNSDQLLTGVSWDFGAAGINATDPMITGGSVIIGPASNSVSFDTGSYGPGSDVSGEYGFGNNDGSGALPNLVSGNTAGATAFGGANLDGTANIDGPQAGLVATPNPVALGGLGAIENEIIATLAIDTPLADLDFLKDNLVRVEYGSDAGFITTPEPGTLALLGLGVALAGARRRR